MIQKTLMDPNLIVFVQLILDAVADGWTIDPQNPPNMVGYWYETIVQREDEPATKASRAEILAKARAAKAAKAAAEAAGTLAAPSTGADSVMDAVLAAGDEDEAPAAEEAPAEAPVEAVSAEAPAEAPAAPAAQ
jgi:hypothetical protein